MDLLRRRLPVILGLLAFVMLAPQYWIALRTPAIGIYHDDSIYLLTAKSLADGNGYRIPSTPTNMVQTKYPILYPAVLSLVWKLVPSFPANVIWFKALSMVFCLIWLGLSAYLLHQLSADPVVIVSLIALTAACPAVIFLSTSALSEMQFAALLTGCLILLLKAERGSSRGVLILAGVLAGGTYLTRSIGFVLILVPVLYLILRRQTKNAVWFGLPATLLAGPWILFQVLNREAAADPYLSQSNYYSGYNVVLNYAWLEKLQIVAFNVLHLILSPYRMFLEVLPAGAGFLMALPLVLLCGYAVATKVSIGVLRWVVLANVVVVTLWVWPPLRFLIPWLPILLGIAWQSGSARWRNAGVACIWSLFLCASASDIGYTAQSLKTGFWYPARLGDEDWRAFTSMANWVKSNIPSDAVVQSTVDPTVSLFTGRKAVRGFGGNASLGDYLDAPHPIGTAEEFRSVLVKSRVKYLFVTNWEWFSETPQVNGFVQDMIRNHPDEIHLVHRGVTDGFGIYQFDPVSTVLVSAH